MGRRFLWVLFLVGLGGGVGCGDSDSPQEECAPRDEVCNGIDDDCDGQIDEDLEHVTCGVGACLREGSACIDGIAQNCTPGEPAAETCNGIDDDCDGETDEELGDLSCGVGACAAVTSACVGGHQGVCTPGEPTEEKCNGVDDDCDGEIDEDLAAVTCGVGACERVGNQCIDGQATECTPGEPTAETCNEIDDDCDGVVDNGCPAPQVVRFFPAEGALLLDPRPTIYAEFTDEQYRGIDPSTVRLSVDGVDVTTATQVTLGYLSYVPPAAMTTGTHTLELTVGDMGGHLTEVTRTFAVDP